MIENNEYEPKIFDFKICVKLWRPNKILKEKTIININVELHVQANA